MGYLMVFLIVISLIVFFKWWDIKRSIRAIRRMFAYFFFVRKLVDFDYNSCLEILEFQLERLEKTIRKNDRTLESEKVAENIKKWRKTLNYLYGDFNEYTFDDATFNAIECKLGKRDFIFYPTDKEEKFFELLTDWKNGNHEYNDRFNRKFHYIREKKKEKLKKEMWQDFCNNIEKWWD